MTKEIMDRPVFGEKWERFAKNTRANRTAATILAFIGGFGVLFDLLEGHYWSALRYIPFILSFGLAARALGRRIEAEEKEAGKAL